MPIDIHWPLWPTNLIGDYGRLFIFRFFHVRSNRKAFLEALQVSVPAFHRRLIPPSCSIDSRPFCHADRNKPSGSTLVADHYQLLDRSRAREERPFFAGGIARWCWTIARAVECASHGKWAHVRVFEGKTYGTRTLQRKTTNCR